VADKPGHGVAPCRDDDLDDLLDRFDFGRSFGFEHDPVHFGRHFAGTISPYLYAGRKFDTFTQTYFNRWRSYNPRYGRFLSSDPLGFAAGNNLWSYPLNPALYADPFGLTWEAAAEYLNLTAHP